MAYRFLFHSHFFSSLSSCRHKSLTSTLYSINSLNSHLLEPSSTLPQLPIHNIPKRWNLGHYHTHSDHRHHHPQPSNREAEKVFRLGLASDIGLAVGKAFTGYLSGSTAIIADAAHSVSDVVLSGVALWSFKAGNAPRDKEHPYGHGKFESLGALGISCMLLVTAGGISWHALDLLLGLLTASPEVVNHSMAHGHVHSHSHSGHHHAIDMDHPMLALSMTILSISVKEGLYWITKQAGERQGSGLMKANAWHHRADAISSVVALIGVGGSILGVKFLNPLAGLVVSGMILKAGLDSGYQSVLELVDAAIAEQDLDLIKQTILRVEGVKGCHRLRGRRAGSFLYLDVHIEVDPFCSVSAAHGIGEKVRWEIHKSHPEIAEVFIHIDPAFLQVCPHTRNPQDCSEGKMNQIQQVSLDDEQIEAMVSNAFLSRFPEETKVEQIRRHILQGKIYLEIEVSMPQDLLIREAKKVAEAAENEILKAAKDIVKVSIQLRLGQPINKFNHKSTYKHN